ncbi:MAG TPA: heme peroxidase family protein [Longimicrobium sp.]|nr:heme peroxidase family protein [Longimicrobium sp.]
MSDPTAGAASTATGATLAGFSATGEGGIPISLVRDTAVLKDGTPQEGTSAFQTPQQISISISSLEPAVAQQLVANVIPQPLPPPPDSIVRSLKALDPKIKRFHGVQVPMLWFPGPLVRSPCADMFGYMFSATVRNASKLPFDVTHQALLTQLGNMMADPGRDVGNDSTVPAGYTYFGQFVDHDITLDVTSTIDVATDANTIPNMRRPALDLDSVYGRGPALDPYLYSFPTAAGVPATAVKFQLGRNRNFGPGGPLTAAAATATPTDFDVPRVLNGTDTAVNAAASTFTAIIGDPRNDENVIVSQFHHAMLKFHNRVVDLLLLAGFPGDVFAEAKRIVTRHYQWAVVHDFLPRVCGAAAVNNAIATVVAPVGSAFRMPVEFAVAAYRFGHSMIRNGYVLNSSLPPTASTLKGIFDFIRVPLLPLFSNWATDFNMFFNTAHPVAGKFNNARRIDSVLAPGLEAIPGGAGIMAILAARNLRRGLAFGLPSGQAAAAALGLPVLTPAQLTSGLPANEIALLNSNGGVLLQKTPLWYYVLREARVLQAGNRLGPLGGRIVAETFVRLLKRDPDSFMNVPGFTPSLPSSAPGTFMIADLLEFSGVLVQ